MTDQGQKTSLPHICTYWQAAAGFSSMMQKQQQQNIYLFIVHFATLFKTLSHFDPTLHISSQFHWRVLLLPHQLFKSMTVSWILQTYRHPYWPRTGAVQQQLYIKFWFSVTLLLLNCFYTSTCTRLSSVAIAPCFQPHVILKRRVKEVQLLKNAFQVHCTASRVFLKAKKRSVWTPFTQLTTLHSVWTPDLKTLNLPQTEQRTLLLWTDD